MFLHPFTLHLLISLYLSKCKTIILIKSDKMCIFNSYFKPKSYDGTSRFEIVIENVQIVAFNQNFTIYQRLLLRQYSLRSNAKAVKSSKRPKSIPKAIAI